MRQRRIYAAIREAHEENGYPIELACELLHVARSAYHKWASGKLSRRTAENERLAEKLEQLHAESPDKGYRRLNDDLRHDCGIHVNDKRVLRICRARDIRSTVKYNNRGCTRQAKNPQYLAENLLDRQFYAAKPNEKWLTDVTEFNFPSEHWTRIRTNNAIERLNREIRRRTRVVGTFPDGNSALMLVCARLRHVAGTQWGNKKYMNMKHLEAALDDASIAG